MNRNHTRIAVLLLLIVAFVAAVGAFITLGSDSGDADSETVTSPPVSDSVGVQADDGTNNSNEEDQVDNTPAVDHPDSDSNDVLVGDPEDDVIGGPDNDLIQGDDVLDGPAGLFRWCPSVQHRPPPGMEDRALSGVYLRGEVFGSEYPVIVLQGPTLNNGDLLEIPISGTLFNSPVGINQFGDHEILRLDLVDPSGQLPPLDLLPTLQSGPGVVFPVGGDEGPLFEDDCFEFLPLADALLDGDSAGDLAESAETRAIRFLDVFVTSHLADDAEALFDTLHPAIPELFGSETCRDYIDRTVGSITAARVVGVGEIGPFELDTPQGPVGFPSAIPVDIEFTTSDGAITVNAAHLPIHNEEVAWLTMCGLE